MQGSIDPIWASFGPFLKPLLSFKQPCLKPHFQVEQWTGFNVFEFVKLTDGYPLVSPPCA